MPTHQIWREQRKHLWWTVIFWIFEFRILKHFWRFSDLFCHKQPYIWNARSWIAYLLCRRTLGGALSDDAVWRLSVAYIGPKSRTERPRKTKTGTEVAHVARLGHHFQGQKVKGQGHQAAVLTAAFTHQAASSVTVGTYSPWELTATLCSGAVGSAARGASALRGRRGAGHIVAAPAQLVKQMLGNAAPN